MNTEPLSYKLNEAFKRFQPLPECPPALLETITTPKEESLDRNTTQPVFPPKDDLGKLLARLARLGATPVMATAALPGKIGPQNSLVLPV